MKTSDKNILFVVCHPDDEALWVGGLISEFSNIPGVNVYVCCLTGLDPMSPRPEEFQNAQKVADYLKGVVVGGALRMATEKLPPTNELLRDGMSQLGLEESKIDLLISHSPYGDEHKNPHHIQTCLEMYKWTRRKKIPFGYFTCIPIPHIRHQSALQNIKRSGSLHVLHVAKCSFSILMNMVRCLGYKKYLFPKFYFSFLVDSKKKRMMIDCYTSIDLDLHKKTYAMFTSNCESIYLMDDRGANLLMEIINKISVPGSPHLFLHLWRPGLGILKLYYRIVGRKVENANHS